MLVFVPLHAASAYQYLPLAMINCQTARCIQHEHYKRNETKVPKRQNKGWNLYGQSDNTGTWQKQQTEQTATKT